MSYIICLFDFIII